MTWTSDELTRIGEAEELEIASPRSDGTLRKPRTIWIVPVDRDLYVRSVNGRSSDWFSGVQTRHVGQIEAGGVRKDVSFVEVNSADPSNASIDAAHRTKYHSYAANIIDGTVRPKARDATVKLVPR